MNSKVDTPVRPKPISFAPKADSQHPEFQHLTLSEKKYLEDILPKVSRTFAVNIRVLKGDDYWSVLVGYLICRILDTIEDSHTLSPEKKIKAFAAFNELLIKEKPREKPFQSWGEQYIGESEVPAENDLMSHTGLVMRAYFQLPRNYWEAMIQSILNMSNGMSHVIDRYHSKEKAVLKDEKELEEYCYYVAGTVGELLTRIFSLKIKRQKTTRMLTDLELQFGLGLQITNILKDFHTDSTRGWSYIPQSLLNHYNITMDDFNQDKFPEKNKEILGHLIKKTAGYHQDSLDYTCLIPRRFLRMRLFCLIPLYFAVRTLKILEKNTFEGDYQNKITRREVKLIVFVSPFIAWSNTLMRISFWFLRR